MPAPLSRVLYHALRNSNRPQFDPGNPHYISPAKAGDGLNRLPWELPFQGSTAVLWPADPVPVAVLPGDARACLRFHPLTKPAFPADMRLKGHTVITRNLGHAAERLGSHRTPGHVPAGTTCLTFSVETHFGFWARTIKQDRDRYLSPVIRSRIGARLHHQLRNIAALATDEAVLQALLRLCRGTSRPVRLTFLRAFVANDRAGARLRQWCGRFPLAAHVLLEERDGTIPGLRAIAAGAPDALTLRPFAALVQAPPRHLRQRARPDLPEFDFNPKSHRTPPQAARIRATARRTPRDLHRFLVTDHGSPRRPGTTGNDPSSLRETLRTFVHNPAGHLEPAETVALDRAVAKAHRTLTGGPLRPGPPPGPDAIRLARRHLEKRARRLLAHPTENDLDTLDYALATGHRRFGLCRQDNSPDLSPLNPTPLRVARLANYQLRDLLRENQDAARAVRTAFERDDELWRRVWTGTDGTIRWQRWTAAVDRWRHHVAAQVADAQDMTAVDATIRWISPAPDAPVNDTVVRPLVSIVDLVHEGRHMHHCAGTYSGSCLDPDAPSHIYALEGPGPARSTLELKENSSWHVEQHTKSGNAAPPAYHAEVAREFAARLTRGRYPYDAARARALRAHGAAAREQAPQHVDRALLRDVLQRAYPTIRPKAPFATP